MPAPSAPLGTRTTAGSRARRARHPGPGTGHGRNSLRRLDRFDSRHEGALQAYLRQAVLNRIRDEARRFTRRPPPAELTDSYEAEAASPLDIAIGREGVARYEAALQRLRPSDREAIIGRLELQHDYQELAIILGKPNANAARVAVTRAIARLLEAMNAA